MNKKSRLLAWLGAALLTVNPIAARSQGTTLTFDELPLNAFQSVPNGYGGLQWYWFWYLDGVHTELQSGYYNAVVSPDIVVFGGGRSFDDGLMPSVLGGVPFNLDSAYLTAGWNDGLQVQALGFTGGVLAYDMTYSVDPTGPTFVSFGFLGVDEVRFYSWGGTAHPGFPHSAEYFALDNLTITLIPEPSSLSLALLGGAVLAWTRRTVSPSIAR